VVCRTWQRLCWRLISFYVVCFYYKLLYIIFKIYLEALCNILKLYVIFQVFIWMTLVYYVSLRVKFLYIDLLLSLFIFILVYC
jgi:hypothetical protein